jgi:glycosyltransferase involved in cell wall biosynthesis
MSVRRLRILSYTTLFPSPARPMRGLFVARRLAQIGRSEDVTVVAPVPLGLEPKDDANAAPAFDGIRVIHPRYWLPPGWAQPWHDRLLYAQTRSSVRSLGAGAFDLVDAQYAYPDGSAARMLAERLGKPYVLTVRGSDLHVLASDPSRRRSIRETLHRAAAVVAVSRPLARLAEELGTDPSRVHWIPNGVDRTEFHPRSRSEARRTLGWDLGRPSVLFVGRLDPIKGVRLLLESIEELRRAGLPDVACYLAGDGPLRGEVGRRVAERGLERTVILLGPVRPDRLVLCYAAADLLCLPSVSEGSPNVVLESLATGTPVVAADVGDVAELLEGAAGGAVVRERTAPGFAEGMRSVLARSWNPETTAAIVASRGWDRVAAAQIDVYRSVLGAA